MTETATTAKGPVVGQNYRALMRIDGKIGERTVEYLGFQKGSHIVSTVDGKLFRAKISSTQKDELVFDVSSADIIR